MNSKIIKDCIILVCIVIFAAIGARFLAGGETLEEYAQNRPAAAASFSSQEASKEAALLSSSESITDVASHSSESAYNSSSSSDSASYEVSASDYRVTYSDGFYYEPLPDNIISRIMGVSYVENENISLDDLCYLVLLYNDFNNEIQRGEMICNKSIAQDVIEIFYELYTSGYQIESIKLIDDFNGDDHESMLANNTSCFNYRVVDNSTRLSRHAYGMAIDLNPFYNPYITYNKDGTSSISPEGSEAYADRSTSFPYKIDENDLAYRLFTSHGFKWGGNWNSVKDYQHFER